MYIKTDYPNFLSNEETNNCFKKFYAGDLNSKNIIVESYVQLVFVIVKKYFNYTPFDKEELISSGLEGLIKSVNTFDLSKNIMFYTYAKVCILNEIRNYIRINKKVLKNDSLDREIENGNDTFTMKELLVDEKVNIEDDYIKNSLIDESLNIVELLPERDKKAVCMFFGVCGSRRYTQQEIALELNISQAQVSRKINKILSEMRKIIDYGKKPAKKMKLRNNKK